MAVQRTPTRSLTASSTAGVGSHTNVPELCAAFSERGALAAFVRVGSSLRLKPKQHLRWEGRPYKDVYLLTQGRMVSMVAGRAGRELILDEHGPGDIFGLEALLNIPAVATVTAVECSVFKSLSLAFFERLLRNEPELAFWVMRRLARCLFVAHRRSAELAYEPLERRVLGALSRLVDADAIRCEARGLIDRPLTVRELAGMVGASRPRVNLILQELIRGGRVARCDGKLLVKR